MRRRTTTRLGFLAIGVIPVALVSTALGIDQAGDVAPMVRRAPAEVSVNGVTPEMFLEHQRELHGWLIAQVPEGADKAVINVALNDQDRADMAAAQSDRSQTPMRVGVVKALSPAVAYAPEQTISRKTGSVRGDAREGTVGGESVWVATVNSPGAVALRVHFTDVSIPARAELYFFNDMGEAYGPYVGAGPNDTGDFWSNSVIGSTATVMLRGSDLDRASFRITEVGHVAIDFPRLAGEGGIASFCSFNASCVQNNSCVNEPAVNDNEGAVAKMRWIYGPYIYICSGGLLADTDSGSQIPYFLTANHCMSTNAEAANLEAYFQYSINCGSTACAGSFNPAPSPSTNEFFFQ